MVRVSSTHPSLRAVIARQHTVKEDPNVAAFPGTGTFQGSGYLQLTAGLQKSQGVILPRGLVEVCCEKPACFVGQEWVDADGLLAQEVLSMTASVSGRNFRVFCATFFRSSGTALVDRLPVFYIRRHISMPPSPFPSPCVDIVSTAKKASKQRDSLSGPVPLYPPVAQVRRL